MGKRRILVVSMLASLFTATQVRGVTIRVDINTGGAGTGPGTASNWSDAYSSLAAALGAASSGDEIWVADGTYKPASAGNKSASFLLVAGVEVYGGFAGTETLESQRDPIANVTILSGDIDGDNILDTDNSYHVVKAPASGSMNDQNTLLDGFTITMGNATSANDKDYGGGVFLNNGPQIRGCIITGNRARDGGGGVYVEVGKAPHIRNCTITDNAVMTLNGQSQLVANGYGGGINIDSQATPVILNTEVSDNLANTGGGVSQWDHTDGNVDSNTILVSCRIINNTATASAGGAYSQGPSGDNISMQFINCVIAGNACSDTSGYGGGINFTKTLPGLVNCTVAENTAWRGGGYAQFNDAGGSVVINNSIFWGNTAEDVGEQVYNHVGTLTIDDTDIEGGSGGVAGSGSATLNNCINIDPEFIGSGDYDLHAWSPAIDVGDSADVPCDQYDVNENGDTCSPSTNEDTVDNVLRTRIICTDVDMGAFEYQPSCVGDINGDGTVDDDDLDIVYNRWGMTGYGDIYPWPCGDGYINTDDLIQVIGAWGDCEEEEFASGGGRAQAIAECIATAEEYGLEGLELVEFLIDCFEQHGLLDD